jgi:hypothetical protein
LAAPRRYTVSKDTKALKIAKRERRAAVAAGHKNDIPKIKPVGSKRERGIITPKMPKTIKSPVPNSKVMPDVGATATSTMDPDRVGPYLKPDEVTDGFVVPEVSK